VCLDILCLSSDTSVSGVSDNFGYSRNEVHKELLVGISDRLFVTKLLYYVA
jgi:hypothetical protein